MKLRAPGPKPIRVAAVRPNEGVKADYRKRLLALIDAMHKDVLRAVTRSYKANPPHALLAKDASPAAAERAVMKALHRKWGKTFADAADKIAAHFADEVLKHNDFALKRTLRDAGFSVKFQTTRPMNDAFQSVRHANVQLIKSIPQQHLNDVEGMVQRSVQHGHDMGQLSKDLQARYEVTKRRAALIARDQNNKATAIMNKVRKLDLGIKRSRWIHTAASKHPRDSHEDMNATLFDTAEGCYDKEYGDFVQPGQLINCGCIAEGIIPGMDDDQEGDDEAA
jgi:uncharacterized protein with gpF-like domain